MESRTTAKYFVEDRTWVAFSLSKGVTYDTLQQFKSCEAFSRRDHTKELKEKGWSSMDTFDMNFTVGGTTQKFVKMRFNDSDGNKLLQLVFIPSFQPLKKSYPLIFMSRPDTWTRRCPEFKRLEYFFSVLEMHFGVSKRPLALQPETLKSMLLKEYAFGMDDIEVHARDPATNIDVKINFPDSSISDEKPDVEKLLSIAVKQSYGTNFPVPKLTGFVLENMDVVYDKEVGCTYIRLRESESTPTQQRVAGIFQDLIAGKVH